MLPQLFVSFLLLRTVSSQMNGEFWWLHEKVAQFQHIEPPAPKFEDISEFDTDDSAKVVFKDNELNADDLNIDRNISLNEGEILPGFVNFNFAPPSSVEAEVLINKTNTINKTHEDFKINFGPSAKVSNETENLRLTKDKNNAKNQQNSVNRNIRPELVYYKLTKPVSNNNRNKIFFINHEDNIKQFIPFDIKKKSPKDNKSEINGDEFRFIFPDYDESLWDEKIKPTGDENADIILNVTDIKKNNNTNETSKNIIKPNTTRYAGKIAISDKIEFDEDRKQTESESICTFITKHECYRNKGIIHVKGLCTKNSLDDYNKICCILPLFRNIGSKSSNQTPNNHVKRNKRSGTTEQLNSALQQRYALLHRSNSNVHKADLVTTTVRSKPAQKIVTPGDYVDPYWNIKNSKFRHQTPQSNGKKDHENTNYDYADKDYSEEYTAEIPKPGLVGFYSDQERLTSWKMKNKAYSYDGYDDISEEESGEGDVPFGYSTFDPRQGQRKKVTTSRSTKRKPQRLMASTEEESMKGTKSPTINFNSDPDFHVLKGFKLVNLVENKNRFVRTTESLCDNDHETKSDNFNTEVDNPDDIYDDAIDLDQQVYNNCGKSWTKHFENSVKETYDPWLALVVLTKSPQTILCYATIIHPRAAITAADCLHGKITGDVTILTGLLNLKKDKDESQHRMASVHIHSDFKPGDLANDLALLYWKRPFRLDASIQPACLSDPHVGDECYFTGWGGYDQALQHRPKSQQATILTPRSCNEKLSAPEVDLPAGAFCASVASRGTVTGIGGPLLCKGGGSRVSIVGVAVYRENIVVLLPAFEWIVSALRTNQII